MTPSSLAIPRQTNTTKCSLSTLSLWFVALLASLGLSACGGGGGGGGGGADTTNATVGVSVSGLASGRSIVLQESQLGSMTVSSNGTYTFTGTVTSNSTYSVTIFAQPTGQICTVNNGTGTVANSNISGISVTCLDAYSVGGNVSGLTSGNSVILQNNGGDSITVTANGSFSFPTQLTTGSTYAVTVLSQPSNESCSVTSASGTMINSDVTNISVTCSASANLNVTATVSGLIGGRTLVLQNNGGDNLLFTVDGTKNFNTSIASNSNYSVSILTQPSGQSCSVGNGNGKAGSSNPHVSVSCTSNSYTVSGSVSGLTSGMSVVLVDNDTNSTSISANGTFTFSVPLASGSTYSVGVSVQPTNENCAVTNSSGTIVGSNITNVSVTCSPTGPYNISATVTGLISGRTLVLQDNGGDNLSFTANGTKNFGTALYSGSGFAVTVQTQPPGQACTVASGSGTVSGTNVNVAVTCSALSYTVGGSVSGLASGKTLVVQNNAGNNKTISAAGSFTFSNSVASGSPYAVTILTQPSGQTCSITNGSGTIVSSNVTNVSVTCNSNTYNVSATVSGLVSGRSITLQDNGGDNLTVTSNGTQNFGTALASGSSYSVTILTAPTGETCSVTSGSGTIGSSNVNVAVACTANTYTIGGTVSGLNSGTSVVLVNNGGNSKTVSADGSFTFSAAVASGSSYSVTVSTSPTNESCTVANGSGTVVSGNISNVTVSCSASGPYNVSATVSGLISGRTLVLRNNGGDNLTFSSNGTQNFATALYGGTSYAVTVYTQPLAETCAVTSGSGSIGTSNVNVSVACTPSTFTVGGSVSGLGSGKSVVLQNNGGDNTTISGNGSFTFGTAVASGSSYAVTILTQPSGQTCTVSNNSGTISAANVISVAVSCSDNASVSGAPLIIATDFVAGPTSGGENNLGAYLTVFGTNLGNFSDWGSTSHLYIGGVEVANYRFLQPVIGGSNNKPASLNGVQALGVQVGSLGGAAAGSVLKIDMTVNGVHPSNPTNGSGQYTDMMTKYDGSSDALTWTVQPGSIIFVDINSGSDNNAGTITSPMQHVQSADMYHGALAMPGSATSTTDGVFPGTYVIVRGGNYSYDGTQVAGSGEGWFIANLFRIGGTAPTGAAKHGPICITSYPGPAGGNAPELVKFYPTPRINGPTNDEGGGGFIGNDQARAEEVSPYDNAAPRTKWIHWSRIFIQSHQYAARDGAPINFASSCDYCRVFNTELTWPTFSGNSVGITNAAGIAGNGYHIKVGLNYIHDIAGVTTGDNGNQNHGIYIDGSDHSANDVVVAFNTFYNLMAGNGVQTYNAQSNEMIQNISVHHNWVEKSNKHGLNQGNSTASAAWYDNVVLYSGEAGIRIVGADSSANNSIRVYNNTIYGWDRLATGTRYGYFDDGGTGGHTIDVRNNIFMLPSGSPYTSAGDFVSIDVGQDSFYSNQYYDANGRHSTKYSSDSSGSYGNPNFTSAGTDFSLQTGSPAINTGASLLTGEYRPYGFLLNTAPQSSAHDRGAYER